MIENQKWSMGKNNKSNINTLLKFQGRIYDMI